jgi:hypothetical protein
MKLKSSVYLINCQNNTYENKNKNVKFQKSLNSILKFSCGNYLNNQVEVNNHIIILTNFKQNSSFLNISFQRILFRLIIELFNFIYVVGKNLMIILLFALTVITK